MFVSFVAIEVATDGFVLIAAAADDTNKLFLIRLIELITIDRHQIYIGLKNEILLDLPGDINYLLPEDAPLTLLEPPLVHLHVNEAADDGGLFTQPQHLIDELENANDSNCSFHGLVNGYTSNSQDCTSNDDEEDEVTCPVILYMIRNRKCALKKLKEDFPNRNRKELKEIWQKYGTKSRSKTNR
jgi:hypothetical protein